MSDAVVEIRHRLPVQPIVTCTKATALKLKSRNSYENNQNDNNNNSEPLEEKQQQHQEQQQNGVEIPMSKCKNQIDYRLVRIPDGPEVQVPVGMRKFRITYDGHRYKLKLDKVTGELVSMQKSKKKKRDESKNVAMDKFASANASFPPPSAMVTSNAESELFLAPVKPEITSPRGTDVENSEVSDLASQQPIKTECIKREDDADLCQAVIAKSSKDKSVEYERRGKCLKKKKRKPRPILDWRTLPMINVSLPDGTPASVPLGSKKFHVPHSSGCIKLRLDHNTGAVLSSRIIKK